MTRLVVLLPLSPLQAGDRFALNEWPRHVPVLPSFRTDASGTEIGDAIRAVATAFSPLHVVAAGDELFGRRHDVPVTVLGENEHLTALHQTLRAAVRPLAVTPDEPAF